MTVKDTLVQPAMERANASNASPLAGLVESRGYMYANESNEELLNMLINANEVGASQETCEKLYNEVLYRMNASQHRVQRTANGACENCGNNCWKLVCETCGAE